jgi:hypothetical protein
MYICHYCVDYKTDSLSDIIRHFKRKTECKCNTIYGYNEAKELSKKKKYDFNFDIKNLTRNDYIFIITHYTDKNNKINDNFINNILSRPQNQDHNKNYYNTNHECTQLQEYNKNEENINENDEITKIENNICPRCDQKFLNIYTLKRHLQNKEACEKRQKTNKIFEDVIKKTEMIKEKEIINHNINNTFVDNSKNINIQNNNNNSNSYNFQIKDFIHERYDISHIKDDYYAQKDFFLYHNFLKIIMENKKNQNIFFSNNEAIVYTDNELCKMNSDKAGYLILDKLNQSFQQLLYKQDDESKKYYEFISNYYRIILGHYKHDTIHKDYDVDERRFVYTANSNMFRSRDKYLMKMMSTLNAYKNSARENMFIELDEIKDIPMMNPNIEDFASVKMRYRDLKDKD